MEKFSQNRTHCPILNTCFEVYSHIINDLCFWHGVCPVKAVKAECRKKKNKNNAKYGQRDFKRSTEKGAT